MRRGGFPPRQRGDDILSTSNELIGAYPSGWIWPEQNFDLMKCLIPFLMGLPFSCRESLLRK